MQNRQRDHNGRPLGTLYRRLVYWKDTGEVAASISREWQLKRWKRQKKIALVESVNHKWEKRSVEKAEKNRTWRREIPPLRSG
jgi:predicted GIY-YIG superfamily endonuclease